VTISHNDNTFPPTGWITSGDGWFVRAMRQGDVSFETMPEIGFCCEGTVFVREVRHCHDYDRGVVTASNKEAVKC
jgi:hypothetical protein